MVTMSATPLFRGIPLPISRLVLGTAFFRLSEMAACHQLLDAFVAAGGTLIDSGRVYGDSEAVIGAWLARSGVRVDIEEGRTLLAFARSVISHGSYYRNAVRVQQGSYRLHVHLDHATDKPHLWVQHLGLKQPPVNA